MRPFVILFFVFMSVSVACAAYYHPLQNFDDDVDRIKTYTNFFGGDHGIMYSSIYHNEISISYDEAETRTGHGRSLRIDYGPLNGWDTYVESFERQWWAPESWLDLTDLFPDYSDSEFQNRHLDSLVFYCKLYADEPLTLQLELHDAIGTSSATYVVDVDTLDEWQRIAVNLGDFTGDFDATKGKYLGITFAEQIGTVICNEDEEGTLYIDDFYLVESDYEKPLFTTEEEMLAYLNQVNFRHFWMAIDPDSYFALDRHTWRDLISVDAIGFQLAAYVVAHRNGWIDPIMIEERVGTILDNLLNLCLHTDDLFLIYNDTNRYATVNGTWAHFLDTGSYGRKDENTEFSIFTNALLLAGVLTASEYFGETNNIRANAEALYSMTDWSFLYRETDSLMYYGWSPEDGFTSAYTDWWTEELDLAFLLATSAPDTNYRIPENPFFASGYNRPYDATAGFIYSWPGAGFTYYFMQMYAKYPPLDFSIYRFDNTVHAMERDLEFCREMYGVAPYYYDERIFGSTACEGPDTSGYGASNYHAYGFTPCGDPEYIANGTIAVYGSGSSILWTPEDAINCLEYYYTELDSQFWADYAYCFWSPIFGFPDAFHLNPDGCDDPNVNCLGFNGPWISIPRFSIDIGPMLMNIDSYLAEQAGNPSLRDCFSGHPQIAPNMAVFDSIIATNLDDTLSGSLSGTLGPGVFIVVDDISVTYGDSLEIVPGTRLEFNGNYQFDIYGYLSAMGTEDDSIEFSPADNIAQWKGIDFNSTASDSCILQYCIISGSGTNGIYLYAAHATIDRCHIRDNGNVSHPNYGGGIFCADYSAATITNCIISGNRAWWHGGGICCREHCVVTIDSCLISGNVTGNTYGHAEGGGVACLENALVTITNSIISDNEAHYLGSTNGCGGGLSCSYSATLSISHCIINSNHADGPGGGLWISSGNQSVDHCTVVSNSATSYGEGVYKSASCELTVENCIIAFNSGPAETEVYLADSSNAAFGYSLIYDTDSLCFGGILPAGLHEPTTVNYNDDSCDVYYNLDMDPLFYTTSGDSSYFLTAGSPCIDAGDPACPLDPDNTITDMGCYWYDQSVRAGISEAEIIIPDTYSVEAYPNPFNSCTTLRLALPKSGFIQVSLYNVLGREVESLFSGVQEAGYHEIIWNATSLPSGIYLVSIGAGEYHNIIKIALIK